VKNQKALIESVVDAAPVVIVVLDVDERGLVLDNHEIQEAAGRSRHGRTGADADDGNSRRTGSRGGKRTPQFRLRLPSTAKCASTFPGGKPPRWFSCSGSRVREDDSTADAFIRRRRTRLSVAGGQGNHLGCGRSRKRPGGALQAAAMAEEGSRLGAAREPSPPPSALRDRSTCWPLRSGMLAGAMRDDPMVMATGRRHGRGPAGGNRTAHHDSG